MSTTQSKYVVRHYDKVEHDPNEVSVWNDRANTRACVVLTYSQDCRDSGGVMVVAEKITKAMALANFIAEALNAYDLRDSE